MISDDDTSMIEDYLSPHLLVPVRLSSLNHICFVDTFHFTIATKFIAMSSVVFLHETH